MAPPFSQAVNRTDEEYRSSRSIPEGEYHLSSIPSRIVVGKHIQLHSLAVGLQAIGGYRSRPRSGQHHHHEASLPTRNQGSIAYGVRDAINKRRTLVGPNSRRRI